MIRPEMITFEVPIECARLSTHFLSADRYFIGTCFQRFHFGMDAELITRAQNSDFHVSATENKVNNDRSPFSVELVASRFEFFHSLSQLRVSTRCIDNLHGCFYV
jgi:hypothetical protein